MSYDSIFFILRYIIIISILLIQCLNVNTHKYMRYLVPVLLEIWLMSLFMKNKKNRPKKCFKWLHNCCWTKCIEFFCKMAEQKVSGKSSYPTDTDVVCNDWNWNSMQNSIQNDEICDDKSVDKTGASQ
eukprot:469032_1